MTARSFHLLLVEDNAAHAKLATMAIQQAPVPASVDRVSDGEQALAYLHRDGPYSDHPDVDLILLDLKAPKVDGIEILKRIKTDPALRPIPVIVLSSSMSHAEAQAAYRNYANSFLTKPLDFDDFQRMINDLLHYWANWNQRA